MMRELRLRHHHLLCALSFVGEGYDRDFVANMQMVVSELRSPDVQVRLSASCDVICSSCPRRRGDRCVDHDSVMKKDLSAASFLGIPEEGLLPAAPLLRKAEGLAKRLDDIRAVCGDCDWAELCNRELRSGDRRGRAEGSNETACQ